MNVIDYGMERGFFGYIFVFKLNKHVQFVLKWGNAMCIKYVLYCENMEVM